MSRLDDFVLHSGWHNCTVGLHTVPTVHFLEQYVSVCHIMIDPSLLHPGFVLYQAQTPGSLTKTVLTLLLRPLVGVDPIDDASPRLLLDIGVLTRQDPQSTDVGRPAQSVSQLIHLA